MNIEANDDAGLLAFEAADYRIRCGLEEFFEVAPDQMTPDMNARQEALAEELRVRGRSLDRPDREGEEWRSSPAQPVVRPTVIMREQATRNHTQDQDSGSSCPFFSGFSSMANSSLVNPSISSTTE